MNFDITPPARHVLDMCTQPGVREIDIMCAAQATKTTLMLCFLAWALANKPGPAMWTVPKQDLAKEHAEERVIPILTANDATQQHLGMNTYDIRKDPPRIQTPRMTIYFAWAGSPSTLASRAIKYLLLDEVDKYPPSSGREADPESLAAERLETFWDGLIIRASTPTTPQGNIARAYQSSHRAVWVVPCPHCSTHQPWLYRGHVRYPDELKDNPDALRNTPGAVWYQCGECEGRIDEADRMRMNLRGVFRPEGATVQRNGVVVDAPEQPARLGFHWNRMATIRGTFARHAAEFRSSKNDPLKLMNFVNSWLGEAWEEYTDSAGQVSLSQTDMPGSWDGTLPEETLCVTCYADVQKDHIWYAVYAWGEVGVADGVPLPCSWLIECGKFARDPEYDETAEGERGQMRPEFRALWEMFKSSSWKQKSAGGEREVSIAALGIDSRYRTDEVYGFCRLDPRIAAGKGANRELLGVLWREHAVDRISDRKKKRKSWTGLRYFEYDTVFFKRRVARMVAEGAWRFLFEPPAYYNTQMESQREVLHRTRGGRAQKVWIKKAGYDADHQFDCAAGNAWLAEKLGIWREPERLRAHRDTPAPLSGWFKQQREKRS